MVTLTNIFKVRCYDITCYRMPCQYCAKIANVVMVEQRVYQYRSGALRLSRQVCVLSV